MKFIYKDNEDTYLVVDIHGNILGEIWKDSGAWKPLPREDGDYVIITFKEFKKIYKFIRDNVVNE